MAKPGIQDNWELLQNVPSARLMAARGQLHQAVQLVTAAAISYLEPKPDDSHTSIVWNPELKLMVSQPLRALPDLRVALRPADLTLLVLEYDSIANSIVLDGLRTREAGERLAALLDQHGLSGQQFTLRKHYELPDYPSRDAKPFTLDDPEALQMFAGLYDNTHGAISRFLINQNLSLPVYIWPHHFDLATLLVSEKDDTGAVKASLGLGFSPGDTSYPDPYFYASPWPVPPAEQQLPDLQPPFRWNRQGWTGMVLHHLELFETQNPQILLARFFSDAFSAYELLTKQ